MQQILVQAENIMNVQFSDFPISIYVHSAYETTASLHAQTLVNIIS